MKLEPWQQRVLDGFKKGEVSVTMAGRNAGKSHWTNVAIKRLMDDIMSRPVEALICNTGTVYGKQYLTVEPIGGDWMAMRSWCKETFGTDDELEYNQRWYAYDRKFWFKNSKDRDWFVIRWNS